MAISVGTNGQQSRRSTTRTEVIRTVDGQLQLVVEEEEPHDDPVEPTGCCGGKCCRHGCSAWCKKYFWEGQELNKDHTRAKEELDKGASWHIRLLSKHRRVLGFLLPAALFHFFWWGYTIQYNMWHLFTDKYFMSITMVFGSLLAGMTSEGGGAVAFPVMTLGFGIAPAVARDFSLMIQTCGMTAAAFTIFFMRVQVEWCSLVVCTLGGAAGMIFGLHVVDPALSPPTKKMSFVSIWFAFASVLVFLNRSHKRRTFKQIPNFNAWKCIVLFLGGFLGGIFTSFAGSGLDICSFSLLTLLFRISEKVATPTSVILMAGNSIVGFYWRGVMLQEISQEAWDFFTVCVPIVVFGAPIGSVLGSHFHRLVLAALVIIIDVVALVTAFIILQPMSAELIGMSVGIIIGGFFLFMALSFAGQKLLNSIERSERNPSSANGGNGLQDCAIIGQSYKNTGSRDGSSTPNGDTWNSYGSNNSSPSTCNSMTKAANGQASSFICNYPCGNGHGANGPSCNAHMHAVVLFPSCSSQADHAMGPLGGRISDVTIGHVNANGIVNGHANGNANGHISANGRVNGHITGNSIGHGNGQITGNDGYINRENGAPRDGEQTRL